jgi:hypothetical protein
MDRKMTHAARAELAEAIRLRYQSATGKQKRKILDEFVASTGYHDKSAISVLNGQPVTKGRQTRNRPSIYDEAARAALIVLWEASDRVFGKRLKALLNGRCLAFLTFSICRECAGSGRTCFSCARPLHRNLPSSPMRWLQGSRIPAEGSGFRPLSQCDAL